MSLIEDITGVIREKFRTGEDTLVFRASDFGSSFMTGFFNRVIHSQELIITNAEKQENNSAISIGGRTSLWKYEQEQVLIHFKAGIKNSVTATVELIFPEEKKTQLEPFGWIEVNKVRQIATCTESYLVCRNGYNCSIIIPGEPTGIPVSIWRETGNNWRIDIENNISHPVSIEQLIKVLGGQTLSGFLPKTLENELRDLSITGIHSIFDLKNKQVPYFQVGVEAKNGWEITHDIRLNPGLQICFMLTGIAEGRHPQITCTVSGTFLLGDRELPLILGVRTGSSALWSFGIQPGKKITLPNLGDLLRMTGESSLVPETLLTLGIDIDALMVDFDPHKKQITYFETGISTSSPWIIIPGYFELTKLGIHFEIFRDTSPAQISGTIYGTFMLGNVSVMCSVEKEKENPDWTITGGLVPGKTISLTKIGNQLFNGKSDVPKGVPDFSFSQLEMSVTPNTKLLSFTAQSADPWKFTDFLSLKNFFITFTYDGKAAKNPLAGTIKAELALGSVNPVTLTLSATLKNEKGAAWEFIGETAWDNPIPAGDLIISLAEKFNLKLPDSLHRFKLKKLRLSFNTATKNFEFTATAIIPVGETILEVAISIHFINTAESYNRELKAIFTIGDAEFEIDLESGSAGTKISASLTGKAPLQFEDLAAKFGFKNVPQLPSSLKLSLKRASLVYDSSKSELVIKASSENYGDAVFIAAKISGKQVCAFGVNLKLSITLADIPLSGNKIPGAENIGIPEAGIWILSGALLQKDAENLNMLIGTSGPLLPASAIKAPILLHAVLKLGASENKTLSLPLGKTGTKKLAAEPEDVSPSTHWIDIQKQFGIFDFKRIGFSYEKNILHFSLDAGIAVGPVAFSFDGLSIASPLTEFKPEFNLNGLGLAFKKGQLDIEGALRKLPGESLSSDTKFQFDGLAVIKAGRFSLSAVGSYAQLKSGDPSLFIYAQLEAAIGGPPPFFITGVMAGFGFNRAILIPSINEVMDFPLLSLSQQSSPGQNAQVRDPMFVLDVLSGRSPAKEGGKKREWLKADPGQYWLAVGLQFTSFQVVKSRALLIAAFGHDLSFSLLGLSTLQLPQSSDSTHPYVFAELQLKAVLQPREGFFGLTALLSASSFVLTPECHLTGGFAMYAWFGENPFAGQFVVSMGGYHPAFSRPDHYPELPRLGFNWAVSSSLAIKGEAYFALTPSCVMAGAMLEALFHDGAVKAWFTAHADLLIAWRPFFYTASIGVSIGVEIHFGNDDCHSGDSFSVSADVQLWGPPTGGKAHVHVVFVSATIHFGSEDATADNRALEWHEFGELLPHPKEVCRITAGAGIYKTEKSESSSSGKAWIVRAGEFRFYTEAAIPSSQLAYDKPKKNAGVKSMPTGIDIRPMNKTSVNSLHRLCVYKDNVLVDCEKNGWKLEQRDMRNPESLWGKPAAPFTQIPEKAKAAMTEKMLRGYEVIAPLPVAGKGTGEIKIKSIRLEYLFPEGKAPIKDKQKATSDFLPAFNPASPDAIHTIDQHQAVAARKAMCSALLDLSLYGGPDQPMNKLASETGHLYDTAPLLQS